jgi:hypothetical protein
MNDLDHYIQNLPKTEVFQLLGWLSGEAARNPSGEVAKSINRFRKFQERESSPSLHNQQQPPS